MHISILGYCEIRMLHIWESFQLNEYYCTLSAFTSSRPFTRTFNDIMNYDTWPLSRNNNTSNEMLLGYTVGLNSTDNFDVSNSLAIAVVFGVFIKCNAYNDADEFSVVYCAVYRNR